MAPTAGIAIANTPSAPPFTSAPGSSRISRASGSPVPETSSGYPRIASATAASGVPAGAETRRRYAPASAASDIANTAAPHPSTPTAAAASPASSSTVASRVTWSGWSARSYPCVGQPAAWQVRSIAACLPEQFARTRSGPPPAARTAARGPDRPYPLDVHRLAPVARGTQCEVRGVREGEAGPQHADGLHRLVGRAREDRPGQVPGPGDRAARRVEHDHRAAVVPLDEAGADHLGEQFATTVRVSHAASPPAARGPRPGWPAGAGPAVRSRPRARRAACSTRPAGPWRT